MKTNKYKNTFRSKSILFPVTALFVVLLIGCDEADEPRREDTPEMITHVQLTFTPVGDGSAVVVNASDPDGEGISDIEVDAPIILARETAYKLSIEMFNELADPASPAYDITSEIREEADEHLIFFSWSNGVFSNPEGNGNIDNRSDDVNYDDQDENQLPLGLETSWTTAASATASGKFRILLKHQPELKSSTSTATSGETDVDVEFDITIE